MGTSCWGFLSSPGAEGRSVCGEVWEGMGLRRDRVEHAQMGMSTGFSWLSVSSGEGERMIALSSAGTLVYMHFLGQ